MTAAKKAAHKAHAPSHPKAQTDAKTRTDEDTAARASAATTGPGNPAITSSEDAAAARQDASTAGNAAIAEQADAATPIAFPANEAPANAAAVENQLTMESRLRAKRVGESAEAQAQIGATPNRATVREVQEAGSESTYQEVSMPAPNGMDEIVFTAMDNGDVEISTQNGAQINSLRGGAHQVYVRMSGADWATIGRTLKSKAAARVGGTTAQSAADQRAGASEDGDPGPAAPKPVVL